MHTKRAATETKMGECMKALRWQDFLPLQPSSERACNSLGIHFSRIHLEDTSYRGIIDDGYLVSISTGPSCLVARHTENGFDIGQLAPGNVIVTPPSRKVEWQITGKAQFINVFFSLRYLRQITGHMCMAIKETEPFRPMFQHKDKLMEGVFAALDAQLELKDCHDHLYIETLARTLCIHLLHLNLENAAKRLNSFQRSLNYEQMEKIRDRVMVRMEERILSADLAECVHISEYHFYRVFKRTTGFTPQQYIKKCRLEKARFLIEHTRLPLLEVSYKTGFADQSHLCREFRTIFGMSPRKLRDQIEYDRNFSLVI